MTDIRAQLSDALRDHRFERWSPESFSRCACGQRFEWPRSDHPEHLADVLLSLPGIAIVELPVGVGWAAEDWSAKPLQRDRPFIRVGVESPLFPDGAREFAAALLAAANAAEDADD